VTSSSLYGNGRSVLKADVAANEKAAADAQAALVAANRERLRMDAPAVDPTLLQGAQAVFVRGRGWKLVMKLNGKSVSAYMGACQYERIPFDRIVDFR